MDIVVHVNTEALRLTEADIEAVLEGDILNGMRIKEKDTVRVIE